MPSALYMLALAIFVMGTSEFMLAGLLPAIATELDVPLSTAGLLTSTFAIGMVIGAPLMAAFARRWPPRITLTTSVLIFAGSHAVGALTQSFTLLLVIRVLSAFANAGFLAVALSTATALVPSNLKGRALSILLSGTTLATIAGVPLGALLGTSAGWRATFWAIVVLSAIAAVGIVSGINPGHVMTGTVEDDELSPRLGTELKQLAAPQVALTMMVGALINGGTFAVLTYLAPIVTESAGLSEVWVSAALVMFGLGSFLGVTMAGRLSDRRPGLVLALGMPSLLAGWILLILFASEHGLLFMLILVQGVLTFGVGSTLIARVLHAASAAPTMGGSYATAALNLGAAAGPILGGLGLTASSGVLAPVGVSAMLTMVALIVTLASWRFLVRPSGR
ncbi:Cmx/CmrA family chloramphenicol efflux MFS transporter [Brevibacterium atlanticum]|uniref:Cmx/CmrA family chloramphenicol efflux MFS transporter n=1 Tax=Brevibacterium atlanticum TaxID=2697563 RepID=UPI001423AF0C|nr:Cmx/CmrA family chloramphenicol efflux MFS transporter [Brevibacterium atlanticum]